MPQVTSAQPVGAVGGTSKLLGVGNEFNLLLACCTVQAGPGRSERIRSLLRGPIDWAELSRLTEYHAVMPLVYRSLCGFTEDVPKLTLERLRQAYHWLSEHELRAAVAYAEAYPEEIEERLRADEYWTPERVWETYPFMRPRTR